MSNSWISIDGEDYYEVSELSDEGVYSRYLGGSGQGIAVNISNLRENLSTNEIRSLSHKLDDENLTERFHSLTIIRGMANLYLSQHAANGNFSQTAQNIYGFELGFHANRKSENLANY